MLAAALAELPWNQTAGRRSPDPQQSRSVVVRWMMFVYPPSNCDGLKSNLIENDLGSLGMILSKLFRLLTRTAGKLKRTLGFAGKKDDGNTVILLY